MAKLKKITCRHIEGMMHVSTGGVFSVELPGTRAEHPESQRMKITGSNFEAVEREWLLAVASWLDRQTIDEKVILVRFDSTLRKGGKDFFTNDSVMLMLEACVAIKRTVTANGEQTSRFREHPDFSGLHSEPQPFPRGMILSIGDAEFRKDKVTCVPWSQEAQDMLVRACEGILKIVDMLDTHLGTTEGFLWAIENMRPLLPTSATTHTLTDSTPPTPTPAQ